MTSGRVQSFNKVNGGLFSEIAHSPLPQRERAKEPAATTAIGMPAGPDPVRIRMMVQPAQAEAWLKNNNTHNRPLRESVALKYGEDMEAGRWQYNYQAIIFSTNGSLLDGQHRLYGCVLSQTPLDTDVVFNAPLSVQRVIDSGLFRKAGDQASVEFRTKNANRVAALAKLVLVYRKHGIEKFSSSQKHPTRQEVISEIAANGERLQAAIVKNCGRLCRPSVADFCNYVFMEKNAVLAEVFMRDVFTGDQVGKGNPAFVLRNWLINESKSRAKVRELVSIAMFFKAWSYFCANKPLKILKFSAAEEFPRI